MAYRLVPPNILVLPSRFPLVATRLPAADRVMSPPPLPPAMAEAAVMDTEGELAVKEASACSPRLGTEAAKEEPPENTTAAPPTPLIDWEKYRDSRGPGVVRVREVIPVRAAPPALE